MDEEEKEDIKKQRILPIINEEEKRFEKIEDINEDINERE